MEAVQALETREHEQPEWWLPAEHGGETDASDRRLEHRRCEMALAMKARLDAGAGRPRVPLPSKQPGRPERAHPARRDRTVTAPPQARRREPGPEATGSHPDGPHPDVAVPSWNEADSFRETTLRYFDNPEDQQTLRAMGRLLYDLGTDTTRDRGTESSNRAELRAIAADLRYTAGCCSMLGRSAETCSLDAADEKLARFARKLARRVTALVLSIEEQLS